MQNPITSIKIVEGEDFGPARINMRTGELQLSPVFFNLDPDEQVFVLCHEFSHRELNTKDEFKADKRAFELYNEMGYPLKKTVFALVNILDEKKPFHLARANRVNQLAKDFNEIYTKYKDTMDLDTTVGRKKAQKYNQADRLNALKNCFQAGDYLGCERIISEELKNASQGSRYKKFLENVLRKLGALKSLPKNTQGWNLRPNIRDNRYAIEEAKLELIGFVDEYAEMCQFEGENISDIELCGFNSDDMNCCYSFDRSFSNFSDNFDELVGIDGVKKFKQKQEDKKAKKEERKQAKETRKAERETAKTEIKKAKAARIEAAGEAKKTRAANGQTGRGWELAGNLIKSPLVSGLVGAGVTAATGGLVRLPVAGAEGETQTGTDVMPLPGTPTENAQPEEKEKKTVPMWVWIVGGVVLAAIIAAIVIMIIKRKKA